MKPGRPKSHIKPTYISIEKAGRTIFYELDSKGALVMDNGRFKIHHVNECEERPSEAPSPLKTFDYVDVVDVVPIHNQLDDLEPVTPFGQELSVFGDDLSGEYTHDAGVQSWIMEM